MWDIDPVSQPLTYANYCNSDFTVYYFIPLFWLLRVFYSSEVNSCTYGCLSKNASIKAATGQSLAGFHELHLSHQTGHNQDYESRQIWVSANLGVLSPCIVIKNG
jgi:hypothetical protein